MLKEDTRKAMAIEIMMAIQSPQKSGDDILAVETANKIFHMEWEENDMQTMVKFIRENGTSNSDWPNDTNFLYKRIKQLAFHDAMDYQVITWLEELWGVNRTLIFVINCEEEF
jgi:hypothetical protein